MKAMVLRAIRTPLVPEDRPDPQPGPGEIRVLVEACAVCRTDLHVVDGDLPDPKLPIVPGHEIVGIVDAVGEGLDAPAPGSRVGIPWLGHTCGHCPYCLSGQENLCDAPLFTGYTRDGGFATHIVADAAYAFPLDGFDDPVATAPLMCAGLIGWRSLGKAGDGRRVGLYGFGAAAHILAQVCDWQGREVYAFTRPGDEPAQKHALSLGARWAGGSDDIPPVALDAAIIFAPVGALVPAGARRGAKGWTGRLRRNPHERHSAISLQALVGGTAACVGCKFNPAGCEGLPRRCNTGRRENNDDGLSARTGE